VAVLQGLFKKRCLLKKRHLLLVGEGMTDDRKKSAMVVDTFMELVVVVVLPGRSTNPSPLYKISLYGDESQN